MRDRLVFLSDIHIGTGARTNWYQPAIHEPLLLAAFDWILARGDTIAELVLLGDLVDQWTYPPDQAPPTFAEIVAANPRVLGPGGAIARALDALDGAVTFVPGNHDMGVTADEVGAIRGASGHGVRFADAFPYLPALGQGALACAHGHQFSVFNAPDHQAMPATGLPLGHVVTRLAALWSLQHLGPGQTVADRPGSGEPTGWIFDEDELETVVSGVVARHDSLPVLTTAALLKATGQPDTLPIVLADGSAPTVAALQHAYGDLYTRFHDARWFPGAGYGIEAPLFALLETDLRSDLTHFARQLGKHHHLVVLGHTHGAEDETQRPILFGTGDVYANCGFQCPAAPDLTRAERPRQPTFVEVQVDAAARRFTIAVHAVAPGPRGAAVVEPPLHTLEIGF